MPWFEFNKKIIQVHFGKDCLILYDKSIVAFCLIRLEFLSYQPSVINIEII